MIATRQRLVMGLALFVEVGAAGPAIAQASLSCAPVPPGLVSWWRGEKNERDENHKNDGSAENGASFATGLVDHAFSFDGINDRVVVPDSPSLRFDKSTPFSMEVWIYRISAAPVMHVMGKRAGCDGGGFYQIAMDAGGGTAFDQSTIPLNTWTHLAQTWDGSTHCST